MYTHQVSSWLYVVKSSKHATNVQSIPHFLIQVFAGEIQKVEDVPNIFKDMLGVILPFR